MATFVSESFTDTNGTDLADHTGETGAVWTKHPGSGSGSWIVSSNAATGGDALAAAYYASGVPATAEYTVSATYTQISALAQVTGITGRMDPTAVTEYSLRYDHTGTKWELFKRVDGVGTLLGSYTEDLALGSRAIDLELLDASKKAIIAGVERISSADNEITAAGGAGVKRVSGGAGRASIDNFTATDAAAGATVSGVIVRHVPMRMQTGGGVYRRGWTTVVRRRVIAVGTPGPVDDTVTPADSTHGHSAESPTLTQANVLAPNDVAHGHPVESPTLTQAHALAPADVAHAHPVESPSLTQANVIAPADAAHAHPVDAPSLTQAHTLTPAEATHAHPIEAASLTVAGTLAAQGSTHAHPVEAPTLTQAGAISPDESTHAHPVESPALIQASAITPADATHAHSVESPATSVEFMLVPLDVLHAHLVDGVSLTQAHQLVVADATHAHPVDSPTVGIPSPYVLPITAIITIEPASDIVLSSFTVEPVGDIVLTGSLLPD